MGRRSSLAAGGAAGLAATVPRLALAAPTVASADVANEFFLDANPSGINPGDFWVSHLGTGIIPQAFR